MLLYEHDIDHVTS